MCQIREPHNTDLHRYSILNELLSSNQCLYYKASQQQVLCAQPASSQPVSALLAAAAVNKEVPAGRSR